MSATTTTRNVTYDQVDDLARLANLDENIFLQVIKHRFLVDKVYTNVGDILLAVNPYRNIPGLYDFKPNQEHDDTKTVLAKQISTTSGKLSSPTPHIYEIATKMYRQLLRTGKSQCCIITGESGAGKTESAKHILNQLIHTSGAGAASGGKLQEQIVAINPVLEAFGNAQTRLNGNSSRFGKLVTLQVSPVSRRVCSARISEYLFEKSRVVHQYEGEFSFHIFSYIVHGFDNEEKLKYGVVDSDVRASDYTQCFLTPPGNTDGLRFKHQQIAKLNTLRKALESTGFSTSDAESIFSIVCGIIKLGNIKFYNSNSNDHVSIADDSMTTLREVCGIFRIDADEFYRILTYLELYSRGEIVKKRYGYVDAVDCRDSVAKAIYHRLFSWIVARINQQLELNTTEKLVDANPLTIDVLDIFGFENLQHNSFEQLCINMANEQLQCIFNQQVFQRELLEHEIEGIRTVPATGYIDNADIVEMFFGRPIGMLSLLDEESHFPSGSDESMVAKFTHHFRSHPKFVKFYRLPQLDSSNGKRTKNNQKTTTKHNIDNTSFVINHYAAKVEYHSSGFLKKNRDSLPEKVIELFQRSKSELIQALFTQQISEFNNKSSNSGKSVQQNQSLSIDSTAVTSYACNSNISGKSSFKKRRALLPALRHNEVMPALLLGSTSCSNGEQSSNRKKMTVGNQFKISLSILMNHISNGELHFIRCIKPNKLQKPREIDDAHVVEQLRYTGVLETVRIRREGYSHRPKFSDFIQTYHGLSNIPVTFASTTADKDSGTMLKASERVACIRILQTAAATTTAGEKKSAQGGWCLGRTKVFMRYWLSDKLNAQLQRRHCAAVIIQRHIRGFLVRRRKYSRLGDEEQQVVVCKAYSVNMNNDNARVIAGHCQQQHQSQQEIREKKTYFGFAHHQSAGGTSSLQLPSIVINSTAPHLPLRNTSNVTLSVAGQEAPRDLTPSIIYNDPTQQHQNCVNSFHGDFDSAAEGEEETTTTNPCTTTTEEMMSEGSSINSSLFSYTKMQSSSDGQSFTDNNNSARFANDHDDNQRYFDENDEGKAETNRNDNANELYSNDMQYPWFHGYMSRRLAHYADSSSRVK